MVRYEVSRKDIVRITKKLTKLENSTPRNVRNALNRAATKVRKQLVSGMKGTYTAKGMKIGSVDLFRATPGLLVATISSEGEPERVDKAFKYSAGRQGVKAAVRKGGGGLVKGSADAGAAFIATGGPIAGMIAQRKGKDRLPIQVIRSNSVPKMLEMAYTGKAGPNVEQEAQNILYEEIKKEIQKLTS